MGTAHIPPFKYRRGGGVPVGFIDSMPLKKSIDKVICISPERIAELSRDDNFIIISSARLSTINQLCKILQGYLFELDRDFMIFNDYLLSEESDSQTTLNCLTGLSRNYAGSHVPGYKSFSFTGTGQEHCIMILGDSTSDPGYRPEITNWSEYFSEKLSTELNISGKVYVGGIQGYSSSQILLKLICDIEQISPDAVISFSGISDATGQGQAFGYPFISNDVLFHLKKSKETHLSLGVKDISSPHRWIKNHLTMQSVCAQCNRKFIGILEPFPFIHMRDHYSLYANAFFSDEEQVRIMAFYDQLRVLIRCTAFEDLSDILIGHDSYVMDFVHCNNEGNCYIADRILSSDKVISLFKSGGT